MQLGLIGLGRMGGNMAKRLLEAGHSVTGFDLNPANLAEAKAMGAGAVSSLADLVRSLSAPRAVWVMVPHGKPTEDTITALLDLLSPGDLIATGTPPGVGFARKPPVFLQPGDTCRLEITGLGQIENPVKEA